MRPVDVGRQIAARTLAAAQASGLNSAHYPDPGTLPVVPTLLLFWQDFDLPNLMGEQEWIVTFRGQLFTAVGEEGKDATFADQVVEIDELVVPIVDAFDPNTNRDNYTLTFAVDRCRLRRGELSRRLAYAGRNHYGGELFWDVKLRRAAGSA